MTRVLVVGAGPTGLTAALELARRGLAVEVIERRTAPSDLSRAVGLLKPSLDILQPTGVAQAILAEAVTIQEVRVHLGNRLIGSLPLNFDDRSRIWGLAQDRTEHHMIEGPARLGVKVRFGVTLTGLAQDADGVTAQFSDGAQRFDLVVGADGIHSTVRQGLGLPFDGYDLPDLWSIADVVAPDWLDPQTFQAFLLPQRHVCIVVPLGEHRFRVIATQADALAALPVPMQVSELRKSATFRLSVRQVPRYAKGRVYLAGDAAHCHSPVGGRGMNLGIADAAELARRIADGGLDGYSEARRIDGARVIRITEMARRALQGGRLRRSMVRDLLRIGHRFPPLGRAMMRFVASG